MHGKTVLITGSTDGIGKQAALELARKGAHVILHGRNREKGLNAMEEIQRQTRTERLDLMCADFSLIKNVHALAAEINSKYDRLDVLIHNAGTFELTRRITADGLETTFAVNHLAVILLNYLLLDLIKKSGAPRILVVSSVAHRSARMDLDNLQGEKGYDAYQAYAISKFCNLLFSYAAARRLAGTGITVNALHPGVVDTNLLRVGFGIRGTSVEVGAKSHVYLADSPEVEGVTGKYFEEGRQVLSAPETYDAELQERLWGLSETLSQLSTPRSA